MLFLYLFAVVFCGLWAWALLYMWRSVMSMPLLREEVARSSGNTVDWPSLSIIIPACNEADHLEAALTSLLAQDYPRLEVIVIDDRSTDGTGEIIDRLAGKDPRVRAVHVESLPEGWLGKVNALREGARRAGGAWYLFTDADVYFQPAAIRRAVGYAVRHGLNHLTCVPEVTGPSNRFWLEVAIRAFFVLFCPSIRAPRINREGSRWAAGIGAFNLVEAATFERTPGFEWLRMEPADDMGLGVMLKQAGARARLLNADGEMSVPWYESVGAMIRGLEKNSFGPGANYSYLRQLIVVIFVCLLALIPPLSLLAGIFLGDPILLAAGGIAQATALLVVWLMPRRSLREAMLSLCLPVGVLILAWILVRSAYKCFRNDGIDWRGTHYSLTALRAGQRVRF